MFAFDASVNMTFAVSLHSAVRAFHVTLKVELLSTYIQHGPVFILQDKCFKISVSAFTEEVIL